MESSNRTNSMHSKISRVFRLMQELSISPKDFLVAFLQDEDIEFAVHRRYWAAEKKGWKSTVDVIHAIRDVVIKKEVGKQLWSDLILSEASLIVSHQKPPARSHRFYSAADIQPQLLTDETARDIRENDMVNRDMPFLYQLISHKLSKTVALPIQSDGGKPDEPDLENDSDSENEEAGDSDDELFDGEIKKIKSLKGRMAARKDRIHTTSKCICSMISFVHNRRNNSRQLENSLTFLACGVSNRVNRFLNYIGLVSSSKTANRALVALGLHAKDKITEKLSIKNGQPIAPFLCVDNLDFEQRIHSQSQGNNSQMFHGTWGYLHQVDPTLLSSILPSDLTLETYVSAMEKVPSVQVFPKMLISSSKEEKHWSLVLKSQVAKVLLEHIAKPSDNNTKISINPPEIDQVSHKPPDITMLKLMVASDNSAQGVGEVCTGIIQQCDLEIDDFFSRLQVIDGDLATCSNIQSLRTQRIPSKHNQDTITNLLTLLGGSHTMWNVGLAIFELHYGNASDSRDCGAWRWLDSLGIPSKKTLDKKDFTKMIQNMEKIHEATLVYCVIAFQCTSKVQGISVGFTKAFQSSIATL
ncbi:uncharacterized protein PGTG_00208 [Puccinia graminis f. sp. tritici CRL 75-36-700-3]|uniref:DUF6589 domain-containing protein n=1 Tax=Puccinia graminis f. sp. tritici (strain CRL 75-36-700-3 / race SCCL) TaxID=418459 RepID=E3JRG3_PUCGT|nr:uncharacterized protein PGTG_00208 [Puccinia graminis f. sp. tritici CRL 75-36-700-3]EFP74252.1 hypothetical protein PGTG_00208 [Puccinia graminis f. sp. tritici CRL 75-36-700-3]